MSDSPFVCNGMDAREVLAQIAQQGAVFTNEREAVFYFYGPEPKLPVLHAELEKLGFTVRPTRTEPGRIATINAVVDEQWLGQVMPKICALSTSQGVEYDGWEASIPEAQKKN